LLKHLLAGFAAFEHTSLAPLEREVVAFAVAREIECHYCLAMHSALLVRTKADEATLAALRAGRALADVRLEALRRFAHTLVVARGRVSEAEWSALRAAGFTREQALEVVLGVGVYLLSTLTNVVTEAELDGPFEPFRWKKE
ncbi:MAG TPA: carboxymuconolactone decarboxylase family protein, partial [Polyangiales bacterium]|nr:carboxymuconolactone decarboxylase family protein [Polyangiales bacterium]